MNFNLRNFALWVIIVLLLLALFTLFQNPSQRADAPSISFSQFLNDAEQGRVRDILVLGQEIRGTFTDGRKFQSYGPNDQSWIERIRGKGVSVTISPPAEAPWVISLLVSWFPFLALIGVWIFLSRHWARGQAGPITQSHGEIEGIKRRLDDMQKQLDELSRKDKG